MLRIQSHHHNHAETSSASGTSASATPATIRRDLFFPSTQAYTKPPATNAQASSGTTTTAGTGYISARYESGTSLYE